MIHYCIILIHSYSWIMSGHPSERTYLWIAANISRHCFAEGAVLEDNILLTGHFGHDFDHIQVCIVGQTWGTTIIIQTKDVSVYYSIDCWHLLDTVCFDSYLRRVQGLHSHWKHRWRFFHRAKWPGSTPAGPEGPSASWLRTGTCRETCFQQLYPQIS